MKKIMITLLLVLGLIFSTIVGVFLNGFAQVIPKPSVPEFTVRFVDASYSETTTNPYTGISETKQISNKSIELTIKNQVFNNSNYQIYFNVKIKPHFIDNWTEVYPLQKRANSSIIDGTFPTAEYINSGCPIQSNSSYTKISFRVVPTELYQAVGYDIQRYYSGEENQEGRYYPILSAIPFDAQLDFQVAVLIGHASQYWVIEHPTYPSIGGYFTVAVAYDSRSDWSNTQTISIGNNVSQWQIILIVFAVIFVVVIVFALIYFKKHKAATVQPPLRS